MAGLVLTFKKGGVASVGNVFGNDVESSFIVFTFKGIGNSGSVTSGIMREGGRER